MHLLITGASGQLGGYLLREIRGRPTTVTAWSGSRTEVLFGFPLQPINLTDPEQLAFAFDAARSDVIIHAAAISTVAQCYQAPDEARAINTDATARLTELAAVARARLVLVSTDLVFDGEKGDYREDDMPAPLSMYGRTKLAAEHQVLAYEHGVVVRASLLFGPTLVGRPAFFDDQVRALRGAQPVRLFSDEWRTPLSMLTAARAILSVAASSFTGLLHLGGPERLSRLEMGQRLASFLGADSTALVATARARAAAPEPRPRDVSLNSSRWRQLFPQQPWPGFADALVELGPLPS
jgi:dTDP-4-dehydrorhamnose reductase